MSSVPSYSEWIWSPEHGQYYCYRYNSSGQAEYQWSGARSDRNNAVQAAAAAADTREPRSLPDRDSTRGRSESNYSYQSASGYSADRSSTQASSSSRTTERGSDSERSSLFGSRQSGSSTGADQRFHEGDDVLMAVEERGQLIQASFTIRAGRLDSQGQWEYQLWHDDGTLYDGGYWFKERELN